MIIFKNLIDFGTKISEPGHEYRESLEQTCKAAAYGGFSAIFEFDPATDRVIGVTNRAGQPNPANTRSGRLDPSGDNSRVSATVFKVKYNMLQPSVVAAAPNVRTTWDETWTRLGAR